MDIETAKRTELPNIDAETLRWLVDFVTWKRRKSPSPGLVCINFLLDYIDLRVHDYYFLHRNYTHLMPLLRAYGDDLGPVSGLDRLIEDVKNHLETLPG
ncbi:hypothetical protein [Fundidesulfovibrio agrisoli]|uniref:hypothetical protein n=1 Tax=Fundidesulfovibrio agrisoli TaxID=2922717 RepID=UPI001FAB46AF|nr:hypothetical protein [Fundidesulfovibrio agrisoli]